MKIHEQRDALVRAIEVVLPELSSPTLGAFGIAREDCALVHIDYFCGIQMAQGELLRALGALTGEDTAEVYQRLELKTKPCDCSSCIGKEAAGRARERHRAAHTKVATWAEEAA